MRINKIEDRINNLTKRAEAPDEFLKVAGYLLSQTGAAPRQANNPANLSGSDPHNTHRCSDYRCQLPKHLRLLPTLEPGYQYQHCFNVVPLIEL